MAAIEKVTTNKALPGQTTFISLAMKSYLFALLLVVGASGAGFYALMEIEQRSIDAHVKMVESRLNTDIRVELSNYIDRVQLLAADPHTLSLLENPQDRPVREQALAAMVGASNVRVFARGEEMDLSGDYPRLSYTELDLIYAAEADGLPRIEFHELENNLSHLDIVLPLKHSTETVGYVLTRFKASVLQNTINRLQMAGVRLELVQVLSSGASKLFISWGDEAIKAAGVAASSDFEFAGWQMSVWEEPQHWEVYGVDWRLFFWSAVAVVLASLAMMQLVFLVLLKRTVLDSVNVLFTYVRERLSGQWMGKQYVSGLIELQPTIEHMQNLNWTSATPHLAAQHGVNGEQDSEDKGSAAEASEQGRKDFERSYIDVLYQDKASIAVEEKGVAESSSTPEPESPVETIIGRKPEAKPKPIAAPEQAAHAAMPGLHTALADLLDIGSGSEAGDKEEQAIEPSPAGLDPAIFRAYDIRGVVGKTLSAENCYEIGKAFGTEAWQLGEQTVVVGRDGRHSSNELAEALMRGLRESGRDVIDLGLVPTPLLYFATHYLNARSGVMLTGSHNPPEYNGLKLVLKGETLSETGIQMIYQRIQSGDYSSGEGSIQPQDLAADYVARIGSDCSVGRLKVVLDCGHGAASELAPSLLRTLGCDVVELYCEVDGDFPAHHPDPSRVENLQPLIHAVAEHQADIGLALDGDGDRLGVVDSAGNIIWPDRQLMLYSLAVLEAHPGAQIIYDVKCSRHLHRLIEQKGGRALMWRTGHSVLKAKLQETDAALAGEMSGHIFFNDRWYGFDDGLYCAARLLEIIAKDGRPSAEIFAALPDAHNTPEILLPMKEGRAADVVERLLKASPFPGAQINNLDGIRAEFSDGWGLVRASNTTPCLMLRFEADSEQALERIQLIFRQAIQMVAPEVDVSF